jgi:ribosome maturation factor RimP
VGESPLFAALKTVFLVSARDHRGREQTADSSLPNGRDQLHSFTTQPARQKRIPSGLEKRRWVEGMAFQVDDIRRLAEKVAASHHLEVVDVEFGGGGKSRALRIFVEKDAATRQNLKERVAKGEVEDLPSGVPAELLSGVTHEDCAAFTQDFGTLLDVEDVVPGGEYTLAVSSPGLERKLSRPEEFERFTGSLLKIKTFAPVNGNRVWTGRLVGFESGVVKIHLAAVKQKGKAKKAASAEIFDVPLKDVEKANLVAEI